MNIMIIGAGRAGTSFAAALGTLHHVRLAHHDAVPATTDQDLVLVCVPDDAIGDVAARLEASAHTVVAHVAGSRGLDVLAGHPRVGSLHPLCALPNALVGAQRLRGGVYAVEGDELVSSLVDSLEGRTIHVASDVRTLYHATAVSSSNHLVALMGHVQALARGAGLSLEDFLPLARQALDDVVEFGPLEALTGPASRGDLATLNAHLEALPVDERATYKALAQRALRLALAKGLELDGEQGQRRGPERVVPWSA